MRLFPSAVSRRLKLKKSTRKPDALLLAKFLKVGSVTMLLPPDLMAQVPYTRFSQQPFIDFMLKPGVNENEPLPEPTLAST